MKIYAQLEFIETSIIRILRYLILTVKEKRVNVFGSELNCVEYSFVGPLILALLCGVRGYFNSLRS